MNASTPNGRGSTRWRAPELLALSTKPRDKARVESVRPTYKSDVYSLAMVGIEVIFSSLAQSSLVRFLQKLQIFTRKNPFDSHSDEQVILLLAQDLRPERPVHRQFTSQVWTLTKKCWKRDPSKRPDVSEVLKKLDSGSGNGTFLLSRMLSILVQGARRRKSV